MSQQALHDLLVKLETEYAGVEMLEHEHRAKLEELVESLEQQEIYPDDFDQFSSLKTRAAELAVKYEQRFPKISATLNSIIRTIENIAR